MYSFVESCVSTNSVRHDQKCRNLEFRVSESNQYLDLRDYDGSRPAKREINF